MFFSPFFLLPLGRGNVAARSNFNRLGAFRKPAELNFLSWQIYFTITVRIKFIPQ